MTQAEFLALPSTEKDRLVAEQLGWTLCFDQGYCKGWFDPAVGKYRDGLGKNHHKDLPDFQRDGVAFEHIAPVLFKTNKNLLLGSGDSSIPYDCAVLIISAADGMDVELGYFVQADTWALALALALLTLRGVISEGKEQPR